MEDWKDGRMRNPIIPLFRYSNIPNDFMQY